jgi:hypothetical protein
VRKLYCGAPITLGAAAAAGVRLIVWCKECQHQVEPEAWRRSGRDAVGELLDLQDAYRVWLDSLPENLAEKCLGGSVAGDRRSRYSLNSITRIRRGASGATDHLVGAPSGLLVRLGRLAALTPQLRPKGRALRHQRGPERLSIGARFGRFSRLGRAAPPRVGP